MINEENLYKKYSIIEMQEYIQGIRKFVKADKSEMHKFRCKEGLYKKYREEYLPLYEFGLYFYNSNPEYFYQLIKGNQNFDAEIANNEKLVERIEFTYPQFGKLNYIEAKGLNETGFSGIRLSDDITQLDLIKIILDTAKVKAQKDYSGTTLIIFIDDVFEFDISDADDMLVIQDVIQKLKAISFSALKVYFMILKQRIDGIDYPSKFISIKEESP